MAEIIGDLKQARAGSEDIESIQESDAPPKKIILCFDGTTNAFRGNDADTNVVKLFEMFDRLDRHQYHYYQPGIGTYVANTTISNVKVNSLRSMFMAKSDEMYASSFADHVMAGYKFLMRYYMEGDQVYVFGFSRGAYTARFLCELLNDVGMLSKGNEENLPFLWYHYSDYRRNPEDDAKQKMVKDMARVFCRKQTKQFVYFLGLWDCVNSVAQFRSASESTKYASPNIAHHVRHAASCHERRVMFRPTLFLADSNRTGTCRERWFAGGHGDVGGGNAPKDEDTLLLSDIPLIWMVNELQEQEKKDIAEGRSKMSIAWRTADPGEPNYAEKNRNTFDERKAKHERHLAHLNEGKMMNINTIRHDALDPARAKSKFMAWFWWFVEMLPLAHTNLTVTPSAECNEHEVGQISEPVKYYAQPCSQPNYGGSRRIPLEPHGVIDPSVELMFKHGIIPSQVKYGNDSGKATTKDAHHRYFTVT